jgi:putative ABC transport system ATP-binding protein
VLLADEPTASLDDDAAQAALALLRHTAVHAKATLVVATHDSRAVQVLRAAAVANEQTSVLSEMTLPRLNAFNS